MDKYEYNLRNEEINALIGRREFQKAVAIADSIDWTKVRSVKTLCKISDLYKINRRYKEAKILLEQALDKCPSGKNIVSSLCELCIKMEDLIGAVEYYKMFLKMAPTDSNAFILLYKLYEAQEATLEERISVLEELKKRERIEKWCYELAYLYHKMGLTTRCVEECDDLALWFRDGKYVKKAMELKMLHQQLTPSQEMIYQSMVAPQEKEVKPEENVIKTEEENTIPAREPDEVLVKTVDVGQYSTINIQKALEESIKDTLGENPQFNSGDLVETGDDSTIFIPETKDVQEDEAPVAKDNVVDAILAPMLQDTGEMQELFFEAENTGEIEIEEEQNTDTEDEDVSEGVEELVEIEEDIVEEVNIAEFEPEIEENVEIDELEEASEVEVLDEVEEIEDVPTEDIRSQVAFPDMPVSEDTIIYNKGDITNQVRQAVFGRQAEITEGTTEEIKANLDKATKEELMDLIDKKVTEALENAIKGQSVVRREEKAERNDRSTMSMVVPPRSMQKMLSQDYDGQISLVVPEQEKVEKQITGQINIEEYLSNWENTKKQSHLRTEEEIKKKIVRETGTLFTEFEAKARDGILEKIQSDPDKLDKPIDADKEYEEYLNSILESDEKDNKKEKDEDDGFTLNIPDADIDEEIDEFEDFNTESRDEIADESGKEESVEETEDEVDAEETVSSTESQKTKDEPKEKSKPESKEAASDEDGEGRSLTDDELNLFSQFVQTKKAKQNLSRALDNISLASYTGNVFVTGDTGEESIELSRNVVQYAKVTDSNFSGKIGKVTGSSLNGRDVTATVERMKNGGLIIEKAGDMNADTVKELIKVLNQDNMGILVVMQDTKKEMNKMFSHFDSMKQIFNVHIEIEELSDDALVAYGRQYAEHMEYSIDEMGILALHTRIDELQTSDHIVSVADVRDIVDEAIEHATKFSLKHVTDVLFGKRYDDEDMIILKERDFTN